MNKSFNHKAVKTVISFGGGFAAGHQLTRLLLSFAVKSVPIIEVGSSVVGLALGTTCALASRSSDEARLGAVEENCRVASERSEKNFDRIGQMKPVIDELKEFDSFREKEAQTLSQREDLIMEHLDEIDKALTGGSEIPNFEHV